MRKKIPVTVGSANVFADILKARGLTQAETAAFLGVDQPKVYALLRGQQK